MSEKKIEFALIAFYLAVAFIAGLMWYTLPG